MSNYFACKLIKDYRFPTLCEEVTFLENLDTLNTETTFNLCFKSGSNYRF